MEEQKMEKENGRNKNKNRKINERKKEPSQ